MSIGTARRTIASDETYTNATFTKESYHPQSLLFDHNAPVPVENKYLLGDPVARSKAHANIFPLH